jgi:hypothetical protein
MWNRIRINIKPLTGAVVVATLLWFLVATDKEYTHQITVPIEIVRLATGKTLAEKIPDSAIIELKGKGSSLLSLWFYDVKFRLELPEMRTTQKIVLKEYLTFLELPATFGLEVVEIIEPSTITFSIDDEVIERKPILLSGRVGTADGYVLIDYIPSPDSVSIRGPKKRIQKLDYIYTEPLEISETKTSFTQTVKLNDQSPGLFELTPTAINIEFDVQRLAERTVFDIPISVTNVPRRYTIEASPAKLDLRVKGGEELLAELKPDEITAEIDFSKSYLRGKENYSAKIMTPDKISWIESYPKTFKLIVKRN